MVSGEDLKLANLHISSEFISLNSETKVTVELANAGENAYTKGAQIDFYFNDVKIGTQVITDTIEKEEKNTYSVTFTPDGESGSAQIRAVLTADTESSVKELTKDVTIIKPNGKKVVFDNSHKNIGVANGTMLEFSEILRLFGYQVTFNTDTITADLLADIDVLILNTPAKDQADTPSNKLTAEEETAVAAFVKNGGGLLYSTQSYDQSNYDATQYNTLLEKLGSDIRFNFDGIRESLAEHQDNGNPQSFYSKGFPKSTLGINDDMYALRIYRGGSLVNAEGKALITEAAKELEVLATANKSSYTGKLGDGGYEYAKESTLGGDIIPIVAVQKIGKGNIVVSGRYAYSNYEIGNDASNGAFYLKVVDYLSGLDNYSTVDQIQKTEAGECVSIKGTVTSDAQTANSFWIKDLKGNKIAVVGQKTGSVALEEGVKVIVNGKVSVVNGTKVIGYQSYAHQVQYIGMSTQQDVDDNEGTSNNTTTEDGNDDISDDITIGNDDTSENTTTKDGTTDLPKTGDTAPVFGYLICACVSLIAVLGIVFRKRIL